MECYYRSKPKINEHRLRMHAIWREKGMFNITEQRRWDQQSQIRKNQWLTKLEHEEIQIKDKLHGHVRSNGENEDEQWFLDFKEKDRDVFLKDVRVFLKDFGSIWMLSLVSWSNKNC